MVNRLIALLLGCVLLFCALPAVGMAATGEETDALIASAKESYQKSLASAGKESFQGFCGMMTSHQLWHMGINPGLLSADGNKQYDLYSAMEKTNAGYYINAYSAEEYTLESALNAISRSGTRDVYNLLVCFEWTSTASGEDFGHAVVINGILDGKVYFVESFYTALGGPEGNVIACSIGEFAEMFADWTLFEGVIHFAGKNYTDACKEYPTDLFVRARFSMDLRSQPCLTGENDCKNLRTVSTGELLRVTAVMKNPDGEWYYRVQDGDQEGYLVADTAVRYRTNAEDITMERFTVDAPASDDGDLQLAGIIQAENGVVGTVEITITDENGEVIRRCRQVADAPEVNLRKLNGDIDFGTLADGVYTVTVVADTDAAYIEHSTLQYSRQKILLGQQTLVLGDAEEPAQAKTASYKEEKDGWYWIGGIWYLYRNDEPQTGWVRDCGVLYYLQEDGAVTTGCTQIDGKTYYFSATGALCTGWIKTDKGVRYILSDGIMASGWQIINGSRYFFDADGCMVKRGTMMDGEVEYRFQSDGKAIAVKN